MARRVLPLLFVASFAGLGGCSLYDKPKRPAWRAAAENACFAEKRVRASAYVQPVAELNGPGICGLTRPLRVTALQDGAVRFNSTVTLDCSVVAELDRALTDHELVKVKVRVGERAERDEAFNALSERTASQLVSRIGHVGLYFRPRAKASRIVLPG